MPPAASLAPYDAVLLLSFGGPRGPEEVMPFLERVTAGRGIPRSRLEAVAEHYLARGGISPINDANVALVGALEAELRGRDLPVPVLWGNRNAAPFLAEALRDAHDAGARRVVTILTSAFSSYSSCRQYREDLAAALAELAEEDRSLVVDKIRPYAGMPGLFDAWRDALVATWAGVAEPTSARLLFVTHSIPESMDETSGPGDGEGHVYSAQHLALAGALSDALEAHLEQAHGAATADQEGGIEAEIVYCSRSGPPGQAWLEPDVEDRLEELAAHGVREVVLAPIGFTSDHMEVVQDLDTAAAGRARSLGVRVHRVPTPGVAPAFVGGLVDLLLERAAEARAERSPAPPDWLGEPMPAICAAGCCPNLRAARPAACGED